MYTVCRHVISSKSNLNEYRVLFSFIIATGRWTFYFFNRKKKKDTFATLKNYRYRLQHLDHVTAAGTRRVIRF